MQLVAFYDQSFNFFRIAKITNDVEELKSSDAQLHLELSSEQQKRNSISNRFL